jgi:hypothetical protein
MQDSDLEKQCPLGSSKVTSCGLPEGKTKTKLSLYADTENDRDLWISAICLQIALHRPNDIFNKFEIQAAHISGSSANGNIHLSAPVIFVEDTNYAMDNVPSEINKISLNVDTQITSDKSDNELLGEESSDMRTKRQASIINCEILLPIEQDSPEKEKIDDNVRIMEQLPPPMFHATQLSEQPHNSKNKNKMKKITEWIKKKTIYTDFSQSNTKTIKPTVFGISLEESVSRAHIREEEFIPAVIYRCIEFLETKDGN